MGSVGLPELLIILAIAFFIFGAKRLPQMAKQAGEAVRELRGIGKSVTDVTDELEEEVRDVENTVRGAVRDAERRLDE